MSPRFDAGLRRHEARDEVCLGAILERVTPPVAPLVPVRHVVERDRREPRARPGRHQRTSPRVDACVFSNERAQTFILEKARARWSEKRGPG